MACVLCTDVITILYYDDISTEMTRQRLTKSVQSQPTFSREAQKCHNSPAADPASDKSSPVGFHRTGRRSCRRWRWTKQFHGQTHRGWRDRQVSDDGQCRQSATVRQPPDPEHSPGKTQKHEIYLESVLKPNYYFHGLTSDSLSTLILHSYTSVHLSFFSCVC